MNILKLLAFLGLYKSYIFQVLVKHYLSTDIALFTGQLRNQINKGKTYYKSAWLVLQKYLNRNCNLPAPKWEKSDVKRETSSDCLLTNFAPTSAFLWAGIQTCSGRPSDFPEASQRPARSRPDEITALATYGVNLKSPLVQRFVAEIEEAQGSIRDGP